MAFGLDLSTSRTRVRRPRKSATPQRRKRMVAYRRVSTEDQRDSGGGLAAQTYQIERYAEFHGIEIVWKQDSQSAKNMDRRGLIEALEMIESGEADGIIVAKLDRLSRSMMDFCILVATAVKHDFNIISLDISLDLNSPQGQFLAGVLVLMAEWERKVIGQRTKDALAAKKAAGVKLGRPREADVELVAGVLRLFKDVGNNYRACAKALNDNEVPTTRGGGTWYPSTVRALVLSRSAEQEANPS